MKSSFACLLSLPPFSVSSSTRLLSALRRSNFPTSLPLPSLSLLSPSRLTQPVSRFSHARVRSRLSARSQTSSPWAILYALHRCGPLQPPLHRREQQRMASGERCGGRQRRCRWSSKPARRRTVEKRQWSGARLGRPSVAVVASSSLRRRRVVAAAGAGAAAVGGA